MDQLKIPLTKTHSHIKRPLLAIGACLGVFLIAWLMVRLYVSLDTTSWLHPENTAYTLQLPMYPGPLSQLSEHLGNQQAISQTPWTLNHVLSWCRRSCSIHLDETFIPIGFTLDTALNESLRATFEATGLQTTLSVDGTRLLVSHPSQQVYDQKRTHWTFSGLTPWNDASLLVHETQSSQAVRINKRGLSLTGATGVFDPHRHALSEDAQILAQLAISTASTEAFQSILPQTVQSFFTALNHAPISLAIGLDPEGPVYSIQVPTTLSHQVAAELTHELIKPQSLSTLEWTIEDGTVVSEIRFDESSITANTTSDGEEFFLDVQNNEQTALRLTQSANALILSNRAISLNSLAKIPSTCARRTSRFIRPADLISSLADSNHITITRRSSLLLSFEEVAFFDRRTILCW